MTRSQKTKLIVFLVTTTCLGAAMVLVMTGSALFESTHTYFLRAPGSVAGVEQGAAVSIRGVRVGSVEAIELYHDDRQSVRLTLEIDDEVRPNKNAHATLSMQGVTGLKVVEITGGNAKQGTLEPGSYLRYEASTLEKIQDESEKLITQASEVMANANEFVKQLSALGKRLEGERVDSILASTEQTATRLNRASGELHALVSESREPIQRTLASADAAFRGAKSVTTDASTVLRHLNDTVVDLKGVVRENDANVRAMAYDLRQAAQSFKYLGQELRRKPSRLLMSGAPAERDLPE